MKCRNLLIRKRKYKPYFYCKELRHEIILLECKNCLKRNLVRNKPIKKVSKNKIVVTKDVYEQVLKRDNYRCKICGNTQSLHVHHIIYRSENKKLINEPSNLIVLCAEHHRLVHSNKHMWQPILKEMV